VPIVFVLAAATAAVGAGCSAAPFGGSSAGGGSSTPVVASRVSWPTAQQLIRHCKTKSVGQTHRKLVELVLRNGRKLFTYEPHIDEVIHEVNRLRRGCGPKQFWTE
jgi:hypothetical protein